jgi:CRP-like cAMP-binding protein
MMPPVAANTDFLKRVQLFEDLDSKTLDSIANAAVEQSYAAGQDIVRQGDTGVGAFIIRSGRVAILQEHGGEEHEISQMKTGDFFGDMALLDEFPRSATVRAIEPTCLGITRWHFRGILESHPQLAVKMLPVLTRRIRNAEAHNHEAAAKH